MDNLERSRRKGAGVNKSLSADFQWPEGYGRGVSEMENPQKNGNHFTTERKETSEKSKLSKSAVSLKSHTSTRVRQKKLNYETEKKRQEIELEKIKLENQLRLLQLEHELHEEEIRDVEGEIRSKELGLEDVQPSLSRAQEWVNKSKENGSNWNGSNVYPSISKAHMQDLQGNLTRKEDPSGEPSNDFIEPGENRCNEMNISQVNVGNNQSNDIQLLCQTINNLLKQTNTGSNDQFQNKILARQISDKDFPIFYGDPAEWPLFFEQYERVCKMCSFSQEEIMIKLRKCLRGEAKSAVAGMLLVSENVPMVMETLKMRFGRPDIIIEVIISKINCIPFMKEISLDKLIIFSNEVRNLVETMKSLKSTGHMNNPQLLKDLANKLPDILKLKWGEFIFSRHTEASIDLFSTWLADMANAACCVHTPKEVKKYEDPLKNVKKPTFQQKQKWQEAVLITTTEEMRKCGYCVNGEHRTANCPKLKLDDVNTRWELIKGKKLCFCCLGENHQKWRCKYKKECGIGGCKYKHHKLLHNENLTMDRESRENDRENVNIINNVNNISRQSEEAVTAVQQMKNSVLLRMIPVKLYGPRGEIHTLALCDEGSTVSLIEEDIVKKLGLKGIKESLCIKWTRDISTRFENSQCLDLQISGVRDSKLYDLKNVYTVENLSLPMQTVEIKRWEIYSHLKNLPITDFKNEKPMLLIGQDNIDLITPRQIRTDYKNEGSSPIATKCRLGWSLHGPNNQPKIEMIDSLHFCNKENDEILHDLVKKSFSLDSFVISPHKNALTMEEKKAMEIMRKTARRIEGGRYEIGLIWKDANLKLPESKTTALQRLKCMERKCQRDIEFGKAYCEKIDSYIKKGYMKKLTIEEASIEPPHTWYLPHFATVNQNKPNKIRMVFDAAEKSHGSSLNDYLLTGPDLLASLVAVIIRFRQRKFGFAGDVREMFHMVNIKEEDRCAQRLLWRNLNIEMEPQVYEMQVMIFGAKCSPACAQYVKNSNVEEMSQSPEILTAITKKMYADDYLDSTDTEEHALSKAIEVKRIMSLAGYDLVNWMTNSSLVRLEFEGEMNEQKNITENGQETQRVLGVWWNPEKDTIRFKLSLESTPNGSKTTKRKILRIVMSIFDPLGFLAFHTIGAKVLLQDIWRAGVSWDDHIPVNLKKVWEEWFSELKNMATIEVPRCYSYLIPTAEMIELHIFCDASEKAFSAVAYLRIVGLEEIETSFVMAKTRVAPLKPLSIPRMELQAAVLATRLSEVLTDELEINIGKLNFWSDSKCVLGWIRNDSRKYKPFVAHRIGEIQEKTNIVDWQWIPTHLNVADIATRQHSKDQFIKISTSWLNGPNFLKDPVELWPEEIKYCPELEQIDEESKELKMGFTGTCTLECESGLPEIKRFSNWLRLIRTTAWELRFIENLKKSKDGNSHPLKQTLTILELEDAERRWIRQSQRESFKDDMENMTKTKKLRKNSRLKGLCPEVDGDGIMILGGRLNLANFLDVKTRKPIILCPKNPYTKLLLKFYHDKYGHVGTETILNEIRQKFWIIDGRAALKSIKKTCQKCKNDNSQPKLPIMGQLPLVRVTPCIRPFINVGMDCFGPYFVSIGRRREKRWGVLFTCLAVRAVHLEMIASMNTDSAILAIRRFISRRGHPTKILCDNGTNLRGAANELRVAMKELNETEISNFTTSRAIEFRFIPPGNPHMGGAWERLIGSIKKSLGTVVHGQSLKEETLATLFTEAECIVNARPLTHVSIDPRDPEALTPNHFLVGYTHTEGPPGDFNSGKNLKKEWRKSQMLANSFWKRWLKEYLPTLNRRKKWTDNQEPIKPDDIVIIVDENSPRNHWLMGKVVAVYPGLDGRIRVADVMTKKNTYKKPVSKLCKLEVETVIEDEE